MVLGFKEKIVNEFFIGLEFSSEVKLKLNDSLEFDVDHINSENDETTQKIYFLSSSYVVEKNNFEKLQDYADQYPLLSLRKAFLQIK